MNKNNLLGKMITFGMITMFLCGSVAYGINNNASFDAGFDQQQHQIGMMSASKVANTKLSQLEKSDDFSINTTTETYRNNGNEILFYVFDLQPQGYIVVSSDSNLPPVIAYSFTDNFWSDIPEDNILLQMLIADVE